MENAFTIDVEDYFQVEAFSKVIDRDDWDSFESRVERNTSVILDLLEQHSVQGTFFVLGWVAERFPELVKKIASCGHEIASHGMSHRPVYRQSPEVFREETRRSKLLLEDLCQTPVLGYRAATYSITEKSLWAMEILVEEGFQYDSSIVAVRHDNYGIPGANPLPHRFETPSGSIAEFPISVLRSFGFNLPIAGGGYFRLWPYWFTRFGLGRINSNGNEFVFYLHPWEVDTGQAVISNASRFSKFRHYNNLEKCEKRLKKLLEDFQFTTLSQVLKNKNLL